MCNCICLASARLGCSSLLSWEAGEAKLITLFYQACASGPNRAFPSWPKKARLITVLHRAFAFLACSCIAIRCVAALFQGVASEENRVVVESVRKANINH